MSQHNQPTEQLDPLAAGDHRPLGHAGIIPDGNRRWAIRNALPLDAAYWFAMQKLVAVVDAFFAVGFACVSAFVLSRDNLERQRDDLASVLAAERRCLEELLPALKAKYRLSVFHAGDARLLPADYVTALQQLCEPAVAPRMVTPSLFLCAGYDPVDEVRQCAPRMIEHNDVVGSLWVPCPVDLVVRTAGDQRLSGFLPLQCKYAEFFFEPYFFPDMDCERVKGIVSEYRVRRRRFGK